ncbi:MAG: hypothetical protein ABEJ23_05975 [Haloarculaceae archaeon]
MPFAPFLLGTGAVLWLSGAVAGGSPGPVGVALVVVVGALATVCQALWLQTLAAAVARAASAGRRWLGQGR